MPLYLGETQIEGVLVASDKGGGGGGDLSTATVTLVNNTAEQFDIYTIPVIYEADEQAPDVPAMINLYALLLPYDVVTIKVPLYKGMLFVEAFWWDYTANASGSIVIGDGIIIITGDGTITLTE